ncbi:4955_t:CDS:2, partial [Funneliformis mosseae]
YITKATWLSYKQTEKQRPRTYEETKPELSSIGRIIFIIYIQ